MITIFSLTACSYDKYEVHSVSGLAGLSVSSYEYKYIKFNFEDNTYKLKNKVKQNSIVSEQTGSFTFIDEDTITITNNENPAMDYFLYYNETLYFSEDRTMFYAKAYISGYSVSMVYKLA